jgi:predicted enzyme related to lactoylglutathione lyase
MARPSFIELPVADTGKAKTFYSNAFGWELTDFGESYACTMTGDVDVGLQGDAGQATKAVLVVIAVENVEAALRSVTGAGGVITRPIFAFPGGRRFHFRDPGGNELAAYQAD